MFHVLSHITPSPDAFVTRALAYAYHAPDHLALCPTVRRGASIIGGLLPFGWCRCVARPDASLLAPAGALVRCACLVPPLLLVAASSPAPFAHTLPPSDTITQQRFAHASAIAASGAAIALVTCLFRYPGPAVSPSAHPRTDPPKTGRPPSPPWGLLEFSLGPTHNPIQHPSYVPQLAMLPSKRLRSAVCQPSATPNSRNQHPCHHSGGGGGAQLPKLPKLTRRLSL